MSSVYAFPGAGNVFIPTVQAGLQNSFTRKVDSFPLSSYVTNVTVDKTTFYAQFFDPDSGVRLSDLNNMEWADGSELNEDTQQGIEFVPYTAHRYAAPFRLGDIAAQNASNLTNLVQVTAAAAASKIMTHRTYKVHQVLGTAGNWPAGNCDSSGLSDSGGGRIMVPEGGPRDEPIEARGVVTASAV